MANHKTALILEGGAMRGLYTAGVLDVLMEQGVQVDGIIGVSAGAIHGCNFVSGQAGRSIRYYEKYRSDKHFMGLYSLLTTGELVGRKFCYVDIPLKLDPFDEAAFEASPVKFYATVTNLDTGKAEYIRCPNLKLGSGLEYIRAGASMPLVSRIVRLRGKPYLDGGVADSIPLAAAHKLGYDRCITVLTQPAGYMKKPANMAPFNALYRRYPAFLATMRGRALNYNTSVCLAEQEDAAGTGLLIRPSKALHISRTEKDTAKIRTLYELGRADAAAQAERIADFLAQ